jgi:hypothetical protein
VKMDKKIWIKNQRGAILITLIVSLVLMAVLGSGMLYFSTTSSYGELFANRQERAYYIGESGANYALQKFITTPVANGPFPTLTTFTLSNGQFAVKTYDKPGDTTHLIIESTGIVESGWLTTRQLVTRNIVKATAAPPGMPPTTTDTSGVPIGFDANATTQPDASNKLDNSWTVVPIPHTSYSIEGGDLLFKGTEAVINLNPVNVNLCEEWASNGNLSSYFLQVKIKNSSNPQHFLVGLSFRVRNTSATSDSYGFSFYRYDPANNCNRDWCNNTYGIQRNLKANNKVYAVLWKRVSNQYTVLAYAEMVSSYGVASNGDLLTWPTLLIRVNERSDGNHLKAYVKAPAVPATGSINWSISSFEPVLWTATCTLNSCTSTTPFTEVVDNTFSSSGFCTGTTQNRPEIGVHGFYDTDCNKCQFFDDFGASVQGTSGGGIQY